jgi:hypothetical protein
MGNLMTVEIRSLLFLKSTGVLIGELTEETDRSIVNLEDFYVKDVTFDVSKDEYWYGDYHTGEVRSRQEKPVVTESRVRYSTNTKILQRYPIHKQLGIIINMLDNSSLEKTPEFAELKKFLNEQLNQHREKVKHYSSNPDTYVWISSEQESAEHTKKSIG